MSDPITRIPSGTEFICRVPDEFGSITKLEIIRGKVVATCDSGQKMIVPNRGPAK